MKRSAAFLTIISIMLTPSANAEIAEISNASWQEVLDTTPTETTESEFNDPAYIDINSIVRNGNLIRFDLVNSDASYGRVEGNCRTNQIRSLRFGYFQSVTHVIYTEQEETWADATLYQRKLLRFACDAS